MIILIHGRSKYLSYKAAKEHLDRLSSQFSDFEKTIIDASSSDPSEVINSYRTVSMFTPGKILLIKRGYSSTIRDQLLNDLSTFDLSQQGSTHIIFWEEMKVPLNTKYFKLFKEHGQVDEHDELNRKNALDWVRNALDGQKLTAPRDVMEMIVQYGNFDPERINNLLGKIQLESTDGTVDREMVDKHGVNTLESQIWDLIDSINLNDRKKSAYILERLLSQRVDPIFILSMLIRNCRQLIQVADLSSTGADRSIMASELKIHPFVLSKILDNARNTPLEKLITVYNKLYNLDYEIKSGNIEAELGITLILNII